MAQMKTEMDLREMELRAQVLQMAMAREDSRLLEDRFAAYWAMVSADGAVAPNPGKYTPVGSNH